jgi:hypothetical protein
MKKTILTLSLACFVSIGFAQWIYTPANSNNICNSPLAGSVGIGTNAPVYRFQIWDSGTNGYTGIGMDPGSTPDQNAVIRALKSFNYGLLLRAESQNSSWTQAAIHLKCGSTTATSQTTIMSNSIDLRTGTNYNDIITDNTFGVSALYINNSQQVGIGTSNPGSFKLAVEGALGARSIKVTLTNPWPDYVFSKSYPLRNLSVLEKYISQYQHLPGIPSAGDLQKDGGVDLGQMNAKLLEKVEELTLYVIELKKENDSIKKQLKKLASKHSTLH